MAETPAQPEPTSAFDRLRERGAQRIAPVRFRLAEALARRAVAHAGAARRVLDDKLATLLHSIAALVDAAGDDAVVAIPSPPRRGALGELVDGTSRGQSRPTPVPATPSRDAAPDAEAVAGNLQFFKRTWSRLSADQRLAQSRAALPDNAGPLNSQHLVHRSLTLMRDLSPEYLERFVGYIDALQWLEQDNEATVPDAGASARAASAKRSLPARR